MGLKRWPLNWNGQAWAPAWQPSDGGTGNAIWTARRIALLLEFVAGCLVLTACAVAALVVEAVTASRATTILTFVVVALLMVTFGAAFGWAVRASPGQILAGGLVAGSLAPTIYYLFLVAVELAFSSGDCGAMGQVGNCFDDHAAAVGFVFAAAVSAVMGAIMAVGAFPTWWVVRRRSGPDAY